MNKRPEYMILIAALVAIVAMAIASVASCSAITGAMESAGAPSASSTYDWIFGDDGNNNPNDSTTVPDDGYYSEKDVPASMDIDVPELQDDLQTCINHDIQYRLGLTGKDVKIAELTKDSVSTPELKSGLVLAQVSGKATIENSDGDTDTIDYTSYYYAKDPTAEKITWYIYGYDLGNYDLFPGGFKESSGDPMGVRDYIQDGVGQPKSELSRDKGRDAEKA